MKIEDHEVVLEGITYYVDAEMDEPDESVGMMGWSVSEMTVRDTNGTEITLSKELEDKLIDHMFTIANNRDSDDEDLYWP